MFSKTDLENKNMHLILHSIKIAGIIINNKDFNNLSQQEIFSNTTKFLLDGVVNGYNATVLAYGSTGAGKTYTY